MQLEPRLREWLLSSERPEFGDEQSVREAIVRELEDDELLKALGGPGSGNFGHAGRPGEVGGSAPDGEVEPGDGAMRIPNREQQLEEYKRLRGDWDRLNNQLLNHLDRPDSPEATALMMQQKDVIKQMAALEADPGGLEGIGLPGGPRDMVIIGAGPAGLTTAIAGGTEHLDTLLLDVNAVPGGQPKASSRIENYPGFPIGVAGSKLVADMHSQAERVGAETRLGVSVTGIAYNPETGMKTLLLSNGETIETRAVVIAGGVELRKGDFAGADSPKVVTGDSDKLRELGKGGTVAVLGGSNGAAQAALGVARSADKVFVVSRSPIEKSMSGYQVSALNNHKKIEVIEADQVASFEHSRLTLKSGVVIPCDAVGVFLGGIPNTKWLPATIATEGGKVSVNHGLETSMPGVFAVGDIRARSIGRISTAVGDGHVATHSVFGYFGGLQEKAEAARASKAAKAPKLTVIPPPTPSAPKHVGLAAKTKKYVDWDKLIDRLFVLDLEHPYLGQTVEPEDGLKALGDLPGHEFHGNQWTEGQGSASEPSKHFTPEDHKEVVDHYTNGESNAVNLVLRGGGTSDDFLELEYDPSDPEEVSRMQETIARLDDAMTPLREEDEFYRAVYPEFVATLKVGDSFVDKGFVSTTQDEGLLEDISMDINLDPKSMGTIVVRAEKGTPALDVNKMIGEGAFYSHQKETILGRGLVYRVTAKHGRKIWVETSGVKR